VAALDYIGPAPGTEPGFMPAPQIWFGLEAFLPQWGTRCRWEIPREQAIFVDPASFAPEYGRLPGRLSAEALIFRKSA
jgi:hypothetical protein